MAKFLTQEFMESKEATDYRKAMKYLGLAADILAAIFFISLITATVTLYLYVN